MDDNVKEWTGLTLDKAMHSIAEGHGQQSQPSMTQPTSGLETARDKARQYV